MGEIQILNNGDALYDIRRKINENFEIVQTEVEDIVTDPLSQFGVNEGNVTDGVADLLDLDGTTLNFKVGGEYPNLVMTSGDGVTTEVENINPLYLQNLADGEYTVVVDGSNSNITDAEFYSQLLEPENVNDGDVWFNGENAKQYLTDTPVVSAITPKTTINYKCMGNIDDLYIAAGGGQFFYISRDGGTTWESRVLPANVGGFLSCVVKDGYFYFTTSTSSIMRTSQGEDPEVFHKFADTFYPQKIKVINDLFVLTASGPTLSTSSDGQTWNTITIGTEPIIDVFYINDLYYIISRNGTVYTSEDLITVTQKNKIEQSTYVQCAEIYKNTIIMGGISGSLYIYNLDTGEITLNNISSSEVILDMQVRPNGAMIFVGSNSMCKITYDFITYQNLYTSGGYLEHIYKDFIMGQAGSFLRISQTVQWVSYPYIPVGELTISGGEVTYFTTYPYNSNGLHEATSSTFGLMRTAAVTDEMDCTCNDAVLTPSNLYDLSNYRRTNTSYEVDNKVGCPYHHNLQLKCTQAGTTSNEALDTRGIQSGDVLEDGTVKWEVEELGTGGGGLEIGDIGIAPLGIDETQGKRRYLNGQVIIQEQYVQFTDKVKSAIVLYPNLACSEEDWQATVTLSAFGQCGKFVVDDTAGTIRLPKITGFIQGLNDLASLGGLVEAGLPNITGTWYSSTEDTYFFEPTGAIYRNNLGGDGASGNGGHFDRMYIDASRSNSIYGNSDTVQPESIRYPYFIQVATGAETEDNIINEIELNNPYTLFDNKYAEAPLYNISWLLANGTFNGSNAVHPSAYQALLVENNVEIEVGSTVTLPIGTEYTKRGLSVINSTDTYTDYDFVINTSDETFRLPTKVNLASGKAVVGNGMTTVFTVGSQDLGSDAGLHSLIPGAVSLDTGNRNDYLRVTTDPTKSGIETSDNGLYLYFYVGETVQNANLINAGRIEEKLADKVDTTNTQWAISACMPDYSAGTTLSLTTGTIFNVPYDCMIYLKSTGTTAGGISLKLDNANGLEILGFASATVAVVAVATLYFAKDTKIYVSSIGNLATSLIYPLKGAN